MESFIFMKTDGIHDYKSQRKNDTKQKQFILKKIKTGISSTFFGVNQRFSIQHNYQNLNAIFTEPLEKWKVILSYICRWSSLKKGADILNLNVLT